MDGLGDFIKNISNGAKSAADLLDKGLLKDDLGKAGTVGGLIVLGFDLYKQIKEQLQTEEGRTFSSFYKVAFESAKESIPAEIASTQITDVKRAKQELFQTFTKITGDEWNGYLPDHPTIKKFRRLIRDILRSAQDNNLIPKDNDLIPNFILARNLTLL